MKKAADAADWTGVAPDTSPVAPLDGRTFLVRLQRLSERAASLTILRDAFAAQHARGEQLSRNPDPTARPSR